MVRDAEETRQRLLKAAIAEFSANGIAGARPDRIAATAPADKALIYRFPAGGLLSLIMVIATVRTHANPDFASVKFVTTKKARRLVVTEAVRQLVRP
jgi:hypothetical protein